MKNINCKKVGNVKYFPISKVTFESPLVREGVLSSRGRVDLFKRILKTKKPEMGFTYKDIFKPLKVEWSNKYKKYVVTEGNHRLQAYKELKAKCVPVKISK